MENELRAPPQLPTPPSPCFFCRRLALSRQNPGRALSTAPLSGIALFKPQTHGGKASGRSAKSVELSSENSSTTLEAQPYLSSRRTRLSIVYPRVSKSVDSLRWPSLWPAQCHQHVVSGCGLCCTSGPWERYGRLHCAGLVPRLRCRRVPTSGLGTEAAQQSLPSIQVISSRGLHWQPRRMERGE